MARLLAEYRISGPPVIDEDDKVLDVISETDLMARQADVPDPYETEGTTSAVRRYGCAPSRPVGGHCGSARRTGSGAPAAGRRDPPRGDRRGAGPLAVADASDCRGRCRFGHARPLLVLMRLHGVAPVGEASGSTVRVGERVRAVSSAESVGGNDERGWARGFPAVLAQAAAG
ncbi:hypothetical protein [Streptomyces sp. SD15]